METITDGLVDGFSRDMPALELALLRQGVRRRDAIRERCSRCRRTPLVGERIYLDEAGPVICALCRRDQAEPGLRSRVVHGPGFGRTIRILDQDAA